MASVFAIVSKALFEKMVPKDVKLGTVVDVNQYMSNNKTFDGLKDGGAIFMITVRPPNEKLWLVAILENPKKKGDAWVADANTTPLTDITSAIKKLTFESGTGIKAKKGALGMSLQTPRQLTDDDVELLRGLVPKQKGAGKKVSASEAYKAAVEEAVGSSKKKGAGGKLGSLRLEHYSRPFEGSMDDLEAYEKKQLQQIAGKDAKLESFFGGEGEEEEEGFEIKHTERVDVVDNESDEILYNLYLYPYGDGTMFAHETTKVVAFVCQHGYDPVEDKGKAFVADLAKAWHEGKKRLKIQEMISWPAADDEDDDD